MKMAVVFGRDRYGGHSTRLPPLLLIVGRLVTVVYRPLAGPDFSESRQNSASDRRHRYDPHIFCLNTLFCVKGTGTSLRSEPVPSLHAHQLQLVGLYAKIWTFVIPPPYTHQEMTDAPAHWL
jgi:hypothetical protein